MIWLSLEFAKDKEKRAGRYKRPARLPFKRNRQPQLRPDLKALVALNLLSGRRSERQDYATRVAALFRLRGVNRSRTNQGSRSVVLLVVRTQHFQTRIGLGFPDRFHGRHKIRNVVHSRHLRALDLSRYRRLT